MRRFVFIAAIIAVLGIVVVLVGLSMLNVDKYRPQIQAQAEKKLNRKVSLGPLSLKIFPLSVEIRDLTIQESPEFPSQHPFAIAKQVYAGASSLIRGQPELESLRLVQPRIELIKNAKGVWNFSSLGSSSNTPASKSESSESQVTLGKLTIDDGQLGVTDLSQNQPRSVYDHIDLTLSDYAPHKRFSVSAKAHLPGQGQQLVALDAKVGPIDSGNFTQTPIDGHLSLHEASVSGVERFFASAMPEKIEATASGDADFRSDKGNLSSSGKLVFQNASVRSVQIGYPIQINYSAEGNLDRQLFNIKSADIRLGPTPFAISGQIDAKPIPSTVNLRLNTQNSDIKELARLAGAFGVAFNPNYNVKGTVRANLSATGSIHQPALSGTISAKSLEMSGGDIKQPVTVPQLNLNLTPAAVHADPFTAQSGNTRVNLAFTLSQYTAPNSTVDATLKTANANVAELLSMANAYGVKAAEGITGSGNLSLDVRVQGPTSQPSNLVYSGSANLNNTVLNLPSLTKPVAVKTANVRFQQNSAQLDNLSGSLGSTNVHGNLSVRNFSAPQLAFALGADRINVAELENLSKPQAPSQKAPAQKPPSAKPDDTLTKITGSGTLDAGTIVANELTLTNVHTKCTLDRGVIRLSPLTADLYGGKANGTITMDARQAKSAYAVQAQLTGVDTNQLLSATTSMKNSIFGALAANSNLTFIAAGEQIARTLNGDITFNVTNGRLRNINILKEIAKIAKFTAASPSEQQEGTALKKLSGTLHIRNGVANTDNLVADMAVGSLSASGTINLVDQGLNMRMTAVVSSGVSKAVGGIGVGGYLNTALANKNGELVIPVMVTGTTSKPIVTPDVQAMAQLKMKNLLPTAGDPSKLTSGAINSILGGKGGSPASQLKGVLGGLTGQQNQAGQQDQSGQQKSDQNAQQENPIDSIFRSLQKKKK